MQRPCLLACRTKHGHPAAPPSPPPLHPWQVQDIEQQQQREAQRELARWDERWHLRSRPLAELRALAAQHRIPGRSRMRKQELVSALEAELGFVQLPAPVKAAQPAPGQRLPDEA
ncbi:hypothetical protein ABPG77_000030 [Micractinium sp. CCAP 211/92]